MTTAEALAEMRILLGNAAGILDANDVELSDAHLLLYLKSALRRFSSMEIFDFVYDLSGSEITPELDTLEGLLAASFGAYMLLASDISAKVRSGDLGIRWRSGQDEISTIEASRQVDRAAKDLYKEYRRLLQMKLALTKDMVYLVEGSSS